MIIISPYSRKIISGKESPKNYPYWTELIELLNKYEIIQIGTKEEKQLTKNFKKDLKLNEIKELIKNSDFFISVDNFLPHLAHHINKHGVVIFGLSDPNIFGYPENLNILKDRIFLRKNQFSLWDESMYNINSFESPARIYDLIAKKYKK